MTKNDITDYYTCKTCGDYGTYQIEDEWYCTKHAREKILNELDIQKSMSLSGITVQNSEE